MTKYQKLIMGGTKDANIRQAWKTAIQDANRTYTAMKNRKSRPAGDRQAQKD